VKTGPLRPPEGGVVGGHDYLVGPPEKGIEPSGLIDGGWQMDMGHDRSADEPTDSQRDGHVAGVVHINDRWPVPNTGSDGSNYPEG
jgi:hypothetical protein